MDRFEQEAMDLEADIIRNLSERAAPRIAAWGRRCYAEGRAERTEALKKVVALSHKADEMDDANTLDYSACLTILAGIKAALPKPDDSRHDKTGEGEKI